MKRRTEEKQQFTCCPLGICAMCGEAVKTPFFLTMPGVIAELAKLKSAPEAHPPEA